MFLSRRVLYSVCYRFKEAIFLGNRFFFFFLRFRDNDFNDQRDGIKRAKEFNKNSYFIYKYRHNAVQSCKYFLPVWDVIEKKNKETLSKIFVDFLLSNHGRLFLLILNLSKIYPCAIR